MHILKRSWPAIAALCVLTSLVVTGLTASRLWQFDSWHKIPLRLDVADHPLSRACGDSGLHTLLDGQRLWTACGPSSEGYDGGLAQIDLGSLAVRASWRIDDDALALSDVVAVTMTGERELVSGSCGTGAATHSSASASV